MESLKPNLLSNHSSIFLQYRIRTLLLSLIVTISQMVRNLNVSIGIHVHEQVTRKILPSHTSKYVNPHLALDAILRVFKLSVVILSIG